MTRVVSALIGSALLLSGAANADVVVPNYGAATEADGSFALTSTATAGRTFQLTIAANQLTGMVGQEISGLQFRLNGATTTAWPATAASFASWDIFIGPGVAPSAMSNTFASNFTSTPTQVRSGVLVVPAGSFPAGGSPNAFGPTLAFTTPYLYSGGDLTLEMRFSAQTGVTTQSPLDAVLASGGPTNGWGVDFAARWTASATGVTGNNGNFPTTKLVTVPAPSTAALLGLSLCLATRRRRR